MPYVIAVDVADITDKCFVAFPFAVAKGADHPITDIVEKALVKARLGVFWINQETLARDIVATIRLSITQAPVLIAICTPGPDGKPNANVMYELGLADALGKPTLVMTTDPELLPVDVRNRGAFVYREQDLATEAGRKALINKLVIALQDLQARRAEAWAILDDIPGTHALKATDGIILEPPFWIYAKQALTYAIDVCNAIEGEMPTLNHLYADCGSYPSRTRNPFVGFYQEWADYKQYYASHVEVVLWSTGNLALARNHLATLIQIYGETDPSVKPCKDDFEELARRINEHRAAYDHARAQVDLPHTGAPKSGDLFNVIHSLRSSAQELTFTANAVIRKLVKRICDTFVAKCREPDTAGHVEVTS
ncbi:MAG TPA: hypothetical protein VHE61_05640 [Opitutaceae bacterium]|nr:hypothetical protein [Opitutaceae bacterium]